VVIKTEDDSNDATERPHDDKPSSGMFGFLLCVYLAYLHYTLISDDNKTTVLHPLFQGHPCELVSENDWTHVVVVN